MVFVEIPIISGADSFVDYLRELHAEDPAAAWPDTTEDLREALGRRFAKVVCDSKIPVPEGDAEAKARAIAHVRRLLPELFEGVEMTGFLRPLPGPADGSQLGPAFRLHCPECGKAGQTTGTPSDDGATYRVPMEGDCGHRWQLVVRTADGQTDVFAAPAPAPKGGR